MLNEVKSVFGAEERYLEQLKDVKVIYPENEKDVSALITSDRQTRLPEAISDDIFAKSILYSKDFSNTNIRQKGKKDTALRKEKFAGETKRLVHHYSGYQVYNIHENDEDGIQSTDDIFSSMRKYSINPDFNSDYDAWDKKSANRRFLIGRTSNIMKYIGVRDQEILWDSSKILKIKKEHTAMTDAVIKQVPQILENPIIVLESKTVSGRIVMFSEIVDAANNPVLVAVELNPTSKGMQLDVIKIASAYGKEGNLQKFLNSSKVLYVESDQKKTQAWLKLYKLQLPSSAKLGLNARVTYPATSVNPNIRQKGKKDTALRKEKFAGETKRLVHHYSGTLTAEQQDTLRILDIAAQVLDRTVYIEDSIDGEIAGQRTERGANAYFDPRDNSYHLALDATQQGYLTIMLHEAVHDIAANNRAGYEQLAEVVMKYLQEEKAQEQVREDILRYEQRGYREAEEIEEELVANAVGVILNDRRTAEEFAKRFLARDTKVRKAFMRILDNLREYLKRTIAAIKGEADFRQTELLEKRAGAIEEIRQAMFDAMEGLRSGFSSAQATGIKLSEKNTYPYDMQKVIEEYLDSINHEILEYVNAVKEDSNTDYRRIKVCDVNEKQATDLKRLTGKDFSGYQNAIDKSAISHIEKRHGMDGIADSSMRNAEDIARIGYILQNYDSAELT